MIFNSLDFALFLPIVFIVYWFLVNKSLKLQNFFILLASYFFYGWWDWRFLSLLFFSTIVDYLVGIGLSKETSLNKRKLLLYISIIVNLGLLGFFKYFNFFLHSFQTAFSFFGHDISISSLNIILPIGISFYTFQTMSYSIDVYRRKIEPTYDFIAFSAFVSFFPQLVAGPIERATNLLPQIQKRRSFNYDKAVDGCRQILWGLFQKVMIADGVANYVNNIFSEPQNFSSLSLIIGASLFIIQIYCDFAGYSNIGIGTAKLFGIDLNQNFATPLYSKSIKELWSRWHISLSTWTRDYIYYPLGGSRKSKVRVVFNIIFVFTIIGLWHGADWSFVIFGILNGAFVSYSYLNRKRKGIKQLSKVLIKFKNFILSIITFGLFAFSGIFFRSSNLETSYLYIKSIFINYFSASDKILILHLPIYILIILFLFLFLEWRTQTDKYALQSFLIHKNRIYRYSFYFLLILIMFVYGGNEQQFIYFQF